MVDLVQLAAVEGLSKAGIAETFGFDERQGDYYGNAACYLGLLRRADGRFEATAAGKAFARLRTRAERTGALVGAMLAVPSLREALALLVKRDYRVEKIAAGELSALIRERTGLGASTPEQAGVHRAGLAGLGDGERESEDLSPHAFPKGSFSSRPIDQAALGGIFPLEAMRTANPIANWYFYFWRVAPGG